MDGDRLLLWLRRRRRWLVVERTVAIAVRSVTARAARFVADQSCHGREEGCLECVHGLWPLIGADATATAAAPARSCENADLFTLGRTTGNMRAHQRIPGAGVALCGCCAVRLPLGGGCGGGDVRSPGTCRHHKSHTSELITVRGTRACVCVCRAGFFCGRFYLVSQRTLGSCPTVVFVAVRCVMCANVCDCVGRRKSVCLCFMFYDKCATQSVRCHFLHRVTPPRPSQPTVITIQFELRLCR